MEVTQLQLRSFVEINVAPFTRKPYTATLVGYCEGDKIVEVSFVTHRSFSDGSSYNVSLFELTAEEFEELLLIWRDQDWSSPPTKVFEYGDPVTDTLSVSLNYDAKIGVCYLCIESKGSTEYTSVFQMPLDTDCVDVSFVIDAMLLKVKK